MGDAAWPAHGHAALGVFSLYLFSNDECEESGSQSVETSVSLVLVLVAVFFVPLLLIMMRDFPHVLFLLSSKAPSPGPGSRAHFLCAEHGWALGNPLWQESGAWDVKLCSSCWISPSPPAFLATDSPRWPWLGLDPTNTTGQETRSCDQLLVLVPSLTGAHSLWCWCACALSVCFPLRRRARTVHIALDNSCTQMKRFFTHRTSLCTF